MASPATPCTYDLDLVDLVNLEMDLGVRVRGKLNGSHTPNESYGARHWPENTGNVKEATGGHCGLPCAMSLTAIRQASDSNCGNSLSRALSSASTISTPIIHPTRTPPDAPPSCMTLYLHTGFSASSLSTLNSGVSNCNTCLVTGAGMRSGGGGTSFSSSMYNSEDDKEAAEVELNSNMQLHSLAQLAQSNRSCSRKEQEKQAEALPTPGPLLSTTHGNKCGAAAARSSNPPSSKTSNNKCSSPSTTANGMPVHAMRASASTTSCSAQSSLFFTVSHGSEEESRPTKRQTPASKRAQPPLSSPSVSSTHTTPPGIPFATAARPQDDQLLSRAGVAKGGGGGAKVTAQDKTAIKTTPGANSQKNLKPQPKRDLGGGAGASHGASHGPNQAQKKTQNKQQEIPFQYPPLGMIAMAMQSAREERERLKSRKAKAKKST